MIDVIYNPVAGPKVVNRIDRVRSFLSGRGLSFRVRETGAPGDAVVMAREAAHEGMDVVGAVGGGARHLLRPQPALLLEFPGRERVEAQAVVVARGKKYGGNVTIAPDGDILGETFRVVALLRMGRLSIVKFVIDALRGKHIASRHVLLRECSSLFVRCSIPSACQVDGEYLGSLPVRFTVTDTLLRIVVPKEFPSTPA